MNRARVLEFVALLVLAFALLAGTALRARELSIKRQFVHDEAISYIAATGHLSHNWLPRLRQLRQRQRWLGGGL